MNYEERYRQLLIRAKKLKEANPFDEEIQKFIGDNFPELKESEEETIKKWCITHFEEWIGALGENEEDAVRYIKTKVIPWLEKVNSKTEERKFKVGDWIVYKDNIWKVCNISLQSYYELLKTNNEVSTRLIEDVDNNAHLWTIQDAKDGDVLYLPNGNNEYYFFIFKGIEGATVMSFAHFYQHDDGTSEVKGTIDNHSSVNDVFQPATKEQRDLLFQKMKEAGYEWDAEKKELKNLEQKPAWSEEDKKMLDIIIDYLKPMPIFMECYTKGFRKKAINWLKSIKDRYN